jgi:hypothetical protein
MGWYIASMVELLLLISLLLLTAAECNLVAVQIKQVRKHIHERNNTQKQITINIHKRKNTKAQYKTQ